VTFFPGAIMLAMVQVVSASPPAHGTLGPADAPAPVDAPSIIAVIVPGAADPSMLDALTRLRGEASSVGFSIRLVELPAGSDPLSKLEPIARDLSPAAVVALVPSTSGAPLGAIDVWFLDRASGKTSVGHLTVDREAGERTQLVLAVRVVDFIRARMFDSLVRSSAHSGRKQEAPVHHQTVGRHMVAVGVASTGSFSGFPASFLPSLEVGYVLSPWLRIVIGGSSFGTQPRRTTAAGSATIDQTLLTLAVNVRGRPRWRLYPFADAGVSALFVSVHGHGNPGYLGHDTSSFSPGVSALAGLGAILSSHVFVAVSGGAMVLFRQPQVYIDDSEVARTGWPAWLAKASLGVSF
jgi:hypothetical protein